MKRQATLKLTDLTALIQSQMSAEEVDRTLSQSLWMVTTATHTLHLTAWKPLLSDCSCCFQMHREEIKVRTRHNSTSAAVALCLATSGNRNMGEHSTAARFIMHHFSKEKHFYIINSSCSGISLIFSRWSLFCILWTLLKSEQPKSGKSKSSSICSWGA